MADDKQPADKQPEPARDSAADSAMKWLNSIQEGTDLALKRLREAGSGEGSKGVMIESAVATAYSNRELAAATLSAAEIIVGDLKIATRLMSAEAEGLSNRLNELRKHVDTFTEKADQGTNRLARWTMWLAIVTGLLAVAAGAQVWVTWRTEPMVITIPAPPPPPNPSK
jgi:hypothetical protein